MTYQPKSILVTGGAGFIGANFIKYLQYYHTQVQVVNLDKLTYAGSLNYLQNLPYPNHHHFIRGDITDKELVAHILQHHHIDTIVHFAAESHVDRSIVNPTDFIETNVMGTFNLLQAAKHHWLDIDEVSADQCRFHHISTDEVFGSLQPHDPAFTETTAYDPRSPYSASKASSDHLVRAYHHTYGLPITISNCSNNYGPFQHQEKFIPTVIRACLEEKNIPIYGNGKNIRDWLYVEDHCRGIWQILTNGKCGESYNLGGNNEWENLQLAQLICKEMDKLKPRKTPHEDLITLVTDRPGHDFRYAIDFQKCATELKWQPIETLESGLAKTIRFYMQHQSL